MKKPAVYNEHDRFAAAWLRHLIEEGVIPHGDVDERSICDVEALDYRRYGQVHLFAGIGIWPAALRLAAWPDDRRVGTCSCPCQPFSAAGKGLGFADPRHLWPHAFRLIRELRLDVLFGEQAPTAGHWIDLVAADLEGIGYAFGAPVVPAAGFGGAHIRQRFYWVADTNNTEWWSDRAPRHERDWPQAGRVEGAGDVEGCGDARRLEHADLHQSASFGSDLGEVSVLPAGQRPVERTALSGGAVPPGGMADHSGIGRREERSDAGRRTLGDQAQRWRSGLGASGGDCDWLQCRDGYWRPVESGTFPLAHEDPGRVGKLRAFGNALDLETAANFVAAYMAEAPTRIAA